MPLAASLLVGMLGARPARAAGVALPIALRVTAPSDSGCSSASALEAQVVARLGGRGVTAEAPPQRVDVHFARAAAGRGWSALLQRAPDGARVGTGERQIESASERCSDLDDALVVVLATFVGVAISELVHAGDAERERSDEPSSSPSDEGRGARSRARAEPGEAGGGAHAASAERAHDHEATQNPVVPARAPVEPFQWGLGAAAAAATGHLPALAWGLSANASGEWRALTLSLGVGAFPKSVQSLGGGANARFASLLALAKVCGSVVDTVWLRLGMCAGLRAGALFSRTHGLSSTLASWALNVDAELGLRAVGRLTHRFRWMLGIGALLPLRRTRFMIVESGEETRVYHRVLPGLLLELGGIFGLRS